MPNISLENYYTLKYGCNPYQKKSEVFRINNTDFPYIVLNGTPGFINIIDAINGWFLVSEIKYSINKIASASFKHTSPAGVSIGKNDYEAYKNARECDPKSSFGDFIAINTNVTVKLAEYIRTKICDGIIAPSYDVDAYSILKKKKNYNFIILKGTSINLNNQIYDEYKIIKNVAISQNNNNYIFSKFDLEKIVSKNKSVNNEIINDLIISNITLKYTQSNSVCIAYKGRTIGIGAGQQSRIDCVKLARRKAEIYLLRNNKFVTDSLNFIDNIKYQDKINATIQYIEDDMSHREKQLWLKNFKEQPKDLDINKLDFFRTIDGISISSDGFFPFRDSIDNVSLINTQYICQPGGSIADKDIIEASNDYNNVMIFTGIRLFHH
jgi:phosphoribosylaminoimidazolecarboxamide formyltransferase/IMP cyclohydrolase